MRTYKLNDKDLPVGFCSLIYGRTGVGKTNSLASLISPIAIINTEPRDPRRTLSENPLVKGKNITIIEFDNYDDTMEGLNLMNSECERGKFKFKSLGFDSLTFSQSFFKIEIEDSRYEKETELVTDTKKSRYDTLVDKFRIERSDWGSLGSMMKRLTFMLNKISKYSIYVVATASLTEYPSYSKELEAAPAFQGVDYSSVFAGYFDFIGLVEVNKPNAYPPIVKFVSDGTFLAKSCSAKINEKGGKGILDFEKIIKLFKQEEA